MKLTMFKVQRNRFPKCWRMLHLHPVPWVHGWLFFLGPLIVSVSVKGKEDMSFWLNRQRGEI